MANPPKNTATPQAGAWDQSDLLALNEALEATEAALQGMSMIKKIDIVLQFDDKVVAVHHDGQKWWVKFQ